MAKQGIFFEKPLPSLESFDKEVKKQLSLRERLFSHDSELTELEPNFKAQFLHGNNGWVKLTSGIQIGDDKGKAADRNILQGGVLYKDGEEYKLRKGLSVENYLSEENSGAYNLAQGLSGTANGKVAEGYVPMPGIISFDVKNRGNSGFTREASFKVKCFSLEQLSILEKLYLRPGYKCLVEWGHAVYATDNIEEKGDDKDQPYINPTTILEGNDGTALKTIDLSKTENCKEEKIKEAGTKIISESQHNYDFFIGLIKNYNWTYDQGGYILDIQLMGKGAMSTFLKEMYGGNSNEEAPDDEKKTGVVFNEGGSNFRGLLERINAKSKKGQQEAESEDDIIVECDNEELIKAIKRTYSPDYTAIDNLLNSGDDTYEFKAYRAQFSNSNRSAKSKFTYISMRYLLGMINHFYLEKPNGEDKEPDGKFNTTPEHTFYLTYDEHFSIDPGICLLPQQTKYGLNTKSIPGKKDENKGDILDIHISTHFLVTEFDALQENSRKDKIQLSIGKYLTIVMDKIQASLGSINQFELYNNYYLKKELGPSMIIDLQLLPRPGGQKESYQMISPRGLKSFVREFSFNSELSNSMINIITSQAIVNGNNAGDATSTGLAAFNNGISSRFEVDASGKEISEYAKNREKKKAEEREELLERVAKTYSKFKYDEEAIKKIQTDAATIIRGDLNTVLDKVKPKRGHIGAKVTLKMLGIGGLKALQYFTLPPEILPASYSENILVGFQVNNVSHEISNNEWLSTIEANAIILEHTKKD